MRGSYNRAISVTCLSLILGACSSSDGAQPQLTGGAGPQGNISSTGASDSNSASDGSSDGAAAAGAGGGDTGGVVIDGVGTTGGGVDIVGAAAVPEIQGEWATGCLQQGALFKQQTVSVVGARMLTELSSYSDQACTVPALLSEFVNGATVQRNATTVPTGETRSVSLGQATQVNFYFEEGTVDSKPLPADDFPERNSYIEKIEYDIVLVLDNLLYFGDSELAGYSGQSAETRPISLNTLSIFNRLP